MGAVFSALLHCDILVQGGGTIFHDSYAGRARLRYWKNLTMWLLVFVLARVFRAQVLLLGAGIGPIRHPFTRILCWLALSCTHGVMVRDRASSDAMQDLAIKTRVHPGFDVAVLLHPHVPRAKPAGGQPLVIGVAPCALDPFSKDSTLVTHYWSELAGALGEFASRTGSRIRLFALFTGSAVPSDEKTCCAMSEKLPRWVDHQITIYPGSMQKILAEFAECDVVISARYHGLLAAFTSGCRVLAVTYHRKVGDLARSIGIEEEYIVAADRLMSREFWLSRLEALAQGGGQPTRAPAELAEVARNSLLSAFAQLPYLCLAAKEPRASFP